MVYRAIFVIWLVGAVASNAALRVLGLANPCTYYDSFSGDDTLDLICIAAWPIFWPMWAINWVADRAASRLLR